MTLNFAPEIVFGFMSTPFSGVGCVRTPLSACGGTHPFPAHYIKPVAPGLDDAGLPNTHDARPWLWLRSHWGYGVVGGFFFKEVFHG